MDKDECKNKLIALFNEYEFNRKSIIREYALSNNEVEKGDIFIDHIGPIEVTDIVINYNSAEPGCIYSGKKLNKDYTPMKGKYRLAYQSDQSIIIKKQTKQ